MHIGALGRGRWIFYAQGVALNQKSLLVLKLVYAQKGPENFFVPEAGRSWKILLKLVIWSEVAASFYAQRGTLNKKTIKISYTLKSGRHLKPYCFTLAAPRPPGGPLAPTLDQHAPVRGPPQLWAAPYAPGERGASVVRGPLYPLPMVFQQIGNGYKGAPTTKASPSPRA